MKLIDADALMEDIEIRMKSKENDFKAVSELIAINRYIAQISPEKSRIVSGIRWRSGCRRRKRMFWFAQRAGGF